jgi:DNA-binding GntR family transcriptional regulator
VYTARDTPRRASARTNRSLSGFAYDELKRQLLVGDFPLGRRLRETQLGEALGVSRTPVRDALSRLHAEGLLVRLPEGGFSPAAPNLHEITELYEVRRSLEFTALGRSSHDHTVLDELRCEWSGIEQPTSDADCGPDFVLHDEQFHIGLATASGNQSLTNLLRHVNERIRFVRMHDFLTADRVSKTITEHLGIVEALLDETAGRAGAAERLSAHLEVSERVVEQRAALALSRMVSTSDSGVGHG